MLCLCKRSHQWQLHETNHAHIMWLWDCYFYYVHNPHQGRSLLLLRALVIMRVFVCVQFHRDPVSAVDSCHEGDMVFVLPGVYSVASSILLPDSITIEGIHYTLCNVRIRVIHVQCIWSDLFFLHLVTVSYISKYFTQHHSLKTIFLQMYWGGSNHISDKTQNKWIRIAICESKFTFCISVKHWNTKVWLGFYVG